MEIKSRPSSNPLNLPIRKEICFTTEKDQYSEKIVDRQTKILQPFSSFLKKVLEPDEEIWMAMQATSPMTFLEQMTIGWMIVYLKRCLLIFTNKRILHFPAKANFSPKNSVAQVRYGDIEEIKLSGFFGRTLKLKYLTGKKENFYYVQSKEFKKLKTLIPNIATGNDPSQIMERHHLCPRCVAPLQKDVFMCPRCQLAFKDIKQAIKKSVIFPGGGYFYAGHPMMGIADALVEVVLLVTIISDLVVLAVSESFAVLAEMIPFALFLSVEKLITIYDTKHFINEYIPADKSAVALPIQGGLR